jgi:hypothetical protein
MPKRIVTSIIITILITGCGKTRFHYTYPKRATVKSDGYVIACHRLTDQCENTGEIKKIYETDPLVEMDRILQMELQSTGLFQDIQRIPPPAPENVLVSLEPEVDFRLHCSLENIRWKAPKYKKPLPGPKDFLSPRLLKGEFGPLDLTDFWTQLFLLKIFSQAKDGIEEACEKTEVYGDTRMHVRLTDSHTGEILIDKSYASRYAEKRMKLDCDSAAAKAKVIGQALKMVMEDFKQDLINSVEERKCYVQVSQDGSE